MQSKAMVPQKSQLQSASINRRTRLFNQYVQQTTLTGLSVYYTYARLHDVTSYVLETSDYRQDATNIHFLLTTGTSRSHQPASLTGAQLEDRREQVALSALYMTKQAILCASKQRYHRCHLHQHQLAPSQSADQHSEPALLLTLPVLSSALPVWA